MVLTGQSGLNGTFHLCVHTCGSTTAYDMTVMMTVLISVCGCVRASCVRVRMWCVCMPVCVRV